MKHIKVLTKDRPSKATANLAILVETSINIFSTVLVMPRQAAFKAPIPFAGPFLPGDTPEFIFPDEGGAGGGGDGGFGGDGGGGGLPGGF